MSRFALLGCLLALVAPAASAAEEILFVGNSFTYGLVDPALSYRNFAITDANGTNFGGVPGIFQKLTVQAGLDYDVTIEASGGQTLAGHVAARAAVIGQSKWNAVVLQEYSTRPLPASRGGNPAEFKAAVGDLSSMIRSHNPAAAIYLYETWARPDQFFPANSAYATRTPDRMQADLHDGYFAARDAYGLTGVAPVGDAFLAAIANGVADPTSYAPAPGRMCLWHTDHYHASKYGSYLAAAVLFGRITGVDPRDLDVGVGTAADDLGIAPADATVLNQVAHNSTVHLINVPEPAAAATTLALITLLAARRPRRGRVPRGTAPRA